MAEHFVHVELNWVAQAIETFVLFVGLSSLIPVKLLIPSSILDFLCYFIVRRRENIVDCEYLRLTGEMKTYAYQIKYSRDKEYTSMTRGGETIVECLRLWWLLRIWAVRYSVDLKRRISRVSRWEMRDCNALVERCRNVCSSYRRGRYMEYTT